MEDFAAPDDVHHDLHVYQGHRMGMSLDDLSTQQSAMISVVSGAMTGAFAVWLGSEKK